MTFLIAQSFGEYGNIAAVLTDAWFRLRVAVEDQVRNAGPGTWLVVVGAFVFLSLVFRSRR